MKRYPHQSRRAGSSRRCMIAACMLMPLLSACTSVPEWLLPPRPRTAVLNGLPAEAWPTALCIQPMARAVSDAPWRAARAGGGWPA